MPDPLADDRGFEIGQEFVVQGLPSVPDGLYVVTSTVDAHEVDPLPVIEHA